MTSFWKLCPYDNILLHKPALLEKEVVKWVEEGKENVNTAVVPH